MTEVAPFRIEQGSIYAFLPSYIKNYWASFG